MSIAGVSPVDVLTAVQYVGRKRAILFSIELPSAVIAFNARLKVDVKRLACPFDEA
jgi:hypothetical protein